METSPATDSTPPASPRNFVDEPYAYHHELELSIESLTQLGLGLGRDKGWVVMVPFALPGERVLARIFRNRANYSEADLVEVLEASPDRVDPRCPLFETCGGCQYQHLTYGRQLEWKREQVAGVFQRIAKIDEPPVLPTFPSPEQFGYRSKLTPHWNKPKPGEAVRDIGFLRFGQRNRLVDVPECVIATEAINVALPEAREQVKEGILFGKKKKPKGGTLLLRHVLEGVVSNPEALVSERVGNLTFQFRAGDFFQNNPFILPGFVEHAADEASGDGIDYLVDTYCGVGLFALSLAGRFTQVRGVEISTSAVQWAGNNALLNRIYNCEFLVGTAADIFAEIDFPPNATTVLIDPPRKGCDPDFIQQLKTFGPARLVYVSCDPSTQARDVEMLKDVYRVEKIQPFDLFPQTRHIESIATLTRI